MNASVKKAIVAIRLLGGIACFTFAFWCLASVRTTGFGTSFTEWGSLTAFASIVAPFAFLGLRLRRILTGSFLFVVMSGIVVEGFARAQELSVVHRYGNDPKESPYVRRWWPFGHHSIFFVSGHGWTGCD